MLQEVQGACLEVETVRSVGGFEREGCLGKACGGFGRFGGFEGFDWLPRGARGLLGRLETRAERLEGLRGRVALERLAEGFGGFERAGKRQP